MNYHLLRVQESHFWIFTSKKSMWIRMMIIQILNMIANFVDLKFPHRENITELPNFEDLIKSALTQSKKSLPNESIFFNFLFRNGMASFVKNRSKIDLYYPDIWYQVWQLSPAPYFLWAYLLSIQLQSDHGTDKASVCGGQGRGDGKWRGPNGKIIGDVWQDSCLDEEKTVWAAARHGKKQNRIRSPKRLAP